MGGFLAEKTWYNKFMTQQMRIEKIKNKILPILKQAGAKKSSIFGSYVRGDQTENSDIDILVDFPRGKSLFDFIDLELKLEEALGKKVDLGEYATIKPRLKDYILKEAVQII